MSHFEYIFVAVSIVLSFTLLRLLDAVPTAFSRERGYWVHSVWVVFLLYMCAAFWWLNWFNRNLDELSFRYFLFLLVAPSLLYLTATALVSASPAAIPSWSEHFGRVRKRFFAGLLIYVSILTINSFVTLGVPLQHPIRIGQAAMLCLFAAGAAVQSRRGQAVVAGIASTFLLLTITLAILDLTPMSLD